MSTLSPDLTTSPTEVDPSTWPTEAEIEALIEAERARQAERDELAVVEAELRSVLDAVEQAAAPVTGELPRIFPLTTVDAYRGTFGAVVTQACARLLEIRRTRRTSELADVVAMLQALI